MSNELSPEEVIQILMKSAVPERSGEVDALWAYYKPTVSVVENKMGITLDATKERIEFDPKTIKVFWLIGFAGWRAIESYSPHVLLSDAYGKELQELFDHDEKLSEIERDYRERLSIASSLIQQINVDATPWPVDVPLPELSRDELADDQQKVTYDLVVLATAFAFFHEFRHVMLDRDHSRPNERREEELQCDVWAREFMTAKLANYASINGKNFHEVLQKRSMGLALAALILHEITPKFGYNPHYFSIKIRLKTLIRDTKLPDNDHFWVFVASLMIGILRREHLNFTPAPMPARQLAEYLLDQLTE